jgi:hypothetical protein
MFVPAIADIKSFNSLIADTGVHTTQWLYRETVDSRNNAVGRNQLVSSFEAYDVLLQSLSYGVPEPQNSEGT